MRAAVVGAGPAGLAAAYQLVHAGADVQVFDAADEVGGLARALDLWGGRVDLGSHVLDDSAPDTRALLDELLPGAMHSVPLRRGVMTGGRCLSYPFRPRDVARHSSAPELVALGLGYCSRRFEHPGEPGSAEAWIVRRYGRAACSRFFRPYAEKLSGVRVGEIDASFAAALTGVNAGAPPPRRFRPAPGAPAHAPTFRYPDGGIGEIPASLVRAISAAGAQIRVRTPVRALACRPFGFVVTTDDGDEQFEVVIATVPVPQLLNVVNAPTLRMAPDHSRRPGFVSRSTVLVYVDCEAGPFPELWRYVNDPELRIGRIANFDRWHPTPSSAGRTTPRRVLCCELWCSRGDATWTAPDSELRSLVLSELDTLGIAAPTGVRRTHVERLPATHAVPLIGAPARAAAARRSLSALPGLYLAGTSVGTTDVGSALASGLAVGRSASTVLDLRQGSGNALSRSR
jgi:protoporphyrinogen oxidase